MGKKDTENFPHVSPHIRQSGFQNRENFCSWNPQSRSLGSEIQAQGIHESSTGQGISNPVPGIQSGMHSLQSIIQDCFELSYIGRHVYVSSKTSTYSFFFSHTSDTAVVILLPPDAPITCCTSPLLSVKITADMDEIGRLPGSGKLTTDG